MKAGLQETTRLAWPFGAIDVPLYFVRGPLLEKPLYSEPIHR